MLGGRRSRSTSTSTDVDAFVKRAVDAGATVKMPAEDMFWGDDYCKSRGSVRPPLVGRHARARREPGGDAAGDAEDVHEAARMTDMAGGGKNRALVSGVQNQHNMRTVAMRYVDGYVLPVPEKSLAPTGAWRRRPGRISRRNTARSKSLNVLADDVQPGKSDLVSAER